MQKTFCPRKPWQLKTAQIYLAHTLTIKINSDIPSWSSGVTATVTVLRPECTSLGPSPFPGEGHLYADVIYYTILYTNYTIYKAIQGLQLLDESYVHGLKR